MTDAGQFLPWSLFELTEADRQAIDKLVRRSILKPLTEQQISRYKRDIETGTKVALSLRAPNTSHYYGLCLFGRESPSPLGEKAISVFALTAESATAGGVTNKVRSELVESALLDELRRFCRTHGFTRIQCYVDDVSEVLTALGREGFKVESAITLDDARTYGLSLHLSPSYTGDPYDGSHLLRWLANS